ncbi:iron ABC transporter permease [Paenibacillus thalictri]|uniref:Iron ABC transporter permease n=2 Tax=Paenibacillus thalictri TaxID=2527873 RepID=A0A4V2J3E4_9BACL|nr:iron ABC transporter permease [Paenibacillus thalictri]
MRNQRRFRFDLWTVVTLVSLAFFLLFLIYPLGKVFMASMLADGKMNFDNYINFFKLKYYYGALLNSFIVSGSATVLACMIGIPMAYVMSRFHIPCKGFVHILIILTLLSPPFIGAYSWILMLGNNGFITRFLGSLGIHIKSIYGLHGMIFVFALQYYPHIYLYVSGALKTIDKSLEEASESLGVHAWSRIRKVTLPLIFPTVSMGALMVFMASFSDFGTPMLLGQGLKTLAVLTYEEFVGEMGTNPGMSSTISIVLLLITTLLLFWQRRLVAKKSYAMNSMRAPEIVKLKGLPKLGAYVFTGAVVLLSLIPQATVIVTSFIKTKGPVFTSEFGFDSYREVFGRVPEAIGNTFAFSSVAIVIMVLAGMLISYVVVRKKSKLTALLDAMIMIPYVIPGTVLGISLIIAFNTPPIVMTGTWMILVVAYVIRKLPYTMRSSSAILFQLDRSVEEASISLGVPPMKTFFKTTAILMLPGVLSGAILSWVTTINELSSTVVLYHGSTATITVSIYREVVNGTYGTAAALASILSLCTIVSLIIVNKISGKRGFSV